MGFYSISHRKLPKFHKELCDGICLQGKGWGKTAARLEPQVARGNGRNAENRMHLKYIEMKPTRQICHSQKV